MENTALRNFPGVYQLGGPPREVPLPVRLRLLLGGFLNQFGWIFFGFGMIFVWLFTLQADLTGWIVFRTDLETAQGTITASRKTHTSVGGSEDSDGTPVYEHRYRFLWEEAAYEGVSYRTGGGTLETGQAVSIEFPKGKPTVSRIQGMRRGVVGLVGLVPVLFPAVGLCFMISGLRKGLKGIHLLVNGEPAEGKLISKEETSTKINDKTVYKMTFEFSASDGHVYQAIAKTHLPRLLEDEEAEPLLYDPIDPHYAVLLDDLPGQPRIDSMGMITARSPANSLLCLLIPAVTLIGHGTWLYLKLFG